MSRALPAESRYGFSAGAVSSVDACTTHHISIHIPLVVVTADAYASPRRLRIGVALRRGSRATA